MGSKKRRKNSVPSRALTLTRREFAQHAARAAAVLAALPASVPLHAAPAVDSGQAGPQPPRPPAASVPQQAPAAPKLSAEGLAEAEAKTAEILRRYGARLTEEQKSEISRLVREAQEPLEALRAFPLENKDEPATLLHLVNVPARRPGSAPSAGGARKPAGQGA